MAVVTARNTGKGWKSLFPTRWSFVVFILYMALFINQGILVTASQTSNHGGYGYNTIVAVLLTEVIKLLCSGGLFVHSVHKQSNSLMFDDSSWVQNSTQKNKNKTPASASSVSNYTKLKLLLSRGSSAAYRKLNVLISAFILVRHSMNIFLQEIQQNRRVFFLYFIPAGLYCLYNNLAYTNLVNFDPTTYFLLLQLRVVVTGIVFQILFQKRLSKHQWMSLIFLTFGCMVKEVNFSWLFDAQLENTPLVATTEAAIKDSQNKRDVSLLNNPMGIILLSLQVLCSSSAGVYNEYLLKRPTTSGQKQLPVLIQNVCLYIDSIICNLALLLMHGNFFQTLNYESMKVIFSTPIILAVILNNAAIGIVTSFFLAQLNSILKTFASALELMFTAVLCWIIFGIPIYLNTVFAIVIVTIAILLYSKEPVQNPSTQTVGAIKISEEAEMQKMLNEELDV